MRILVLGAGAVGGYYGARLLQAGADVSFLVRETRARQLTRNGLVVEIEGAPFSVPARGITALGAADRFDIVLLSCKAYDLDAAMDAIAPALASGAIVVPLLNGVAHLDALDGRFGAENIAGGSCHLSGALDADGTIRLLTPLHRIVYGVRRGNRSELPHRLQALHERFSLTAVPAVLSPDIMQELWDKYVLLCTLAGMTSLMRAAVGDIVSTERGREYTLQVLATCTKVAEQAGHALSRQVVDSTAEWATRPGSTFTASMLRDVERGGRTEGEHIVGDMVRRATAAGIEATLLAVAHCHLQAYEARRNRMANEKAGVH